MSSTRSINKPINMSEKGSLSTENYLNAGTTSTLKYKMWAGGDADSSELLMDSVKSSKYCFNRYAKNPAIYNDMTSKYPPPKINRKVDTVLRKVHVEGIWTGPKRDANFPGDRWRFRGRSPPRRKRKTKPKPEPEPELDLQGQFNSCVGAIRAAMHWRWRASEQRHLSHDVELEPWLPQHLRAEKPLYSKWRWNAKYGRLQWTCNDETPVEGWYNTGAVIDEYIRSHPGVFGTRYKKYPNEATWAPVQNDAGIYQRARPRAVERDNKQSSDTTPVTLADIKEVAETAVGQFFPTAYGRQQFSSIPHMDRFLMSLIEYFHYYFHERRLEETVKLNNCMLYDQAGKQVRHTRMLHCLTEAGRCYGKFILGIGMPFHHSNGGAVGTISASSADKQFWEAFYAFAIQVVWIAFARPKVQVIVREMGRIFRGLYFDPARRAGDEDAYRNPGRGASAARSRRSKSSQPQIRIVSTKSTPSSGQYAQKTNKSSVRQQNLATRIAMSRVFSEYDCPPMPPKAIYTLLNSKSALVNSVLRDEPGQQNIRPDSLMNREKIGILGEPHNLFDANLDPIDLSREQKYLRLQFLGPITARERGSRIADTTPFLLQPTPPQLSDLARFT